MFRATLLCAVLASFVSLASFPTPSWGDPLKVSPALEKALLAGDWQAVRTASGPVDEQSPAVSRALQGHACLALNENDESVRLFASLAGASERQAWKEWTAGFRARVDAIPAASGASKGRAKYLEGDGFARQPDWDRAAACFQEATALDPHSALAWNALGVASVLQKNFDQEKATRCFAEASRLDDKFADPHANMGALYLVLEGAPTAVREFKKALACSQGFSLARNGLACALLGKSRCPAAIEEARQEFIAAAQSQCVYPLVQRNVNRLLHPGSSDESDEAGPRPGKAAGFNANLEYSRVANAVKAAPPAQQTAVLKDQMNHYTKPEQSKIADIAVHNARVDNFLQKVPKVEVFGSTQFGGHVGAAAPVGPTIANAKVGGQQTIGGKITFNPAASARQDQKINGMIGGVTRGAPGPGGVKVDVSLQAALGDVGPWPTKATWFGLAPQVKLPEASY